MSLTVPASGEFPVLEREGARLPRLRRDVADAAERDRGDGPLLPRGARDRAPLDLRARRRGDGDVRGRARRASPRSPARRRARPIFTRNATEAINLVAWSWGRGNVGEGDVIALTQMEHHSNIVPWQMLAQERGATLAYVAVADDGRLDLDSLDAVLARGPKLLAVAHVSNVLVDGQPDRGDRAPRARRRRDRRRRRRPGRAAPAGRRRPRSASTSTPGPGTRPTARPASASCTGAASCSRRCRRGSAAGT